MTTNMAVVPVEPTYGMLRAGRDAAQSGEAHAAPWLTVARSVWSAMLSAAPLEGQGAVASLLPTEGQDAAVVDLVERLEARTLTTTESGEGGAFHYVSSPDRDCRNAATLLRGLASALEPFARLTVKGQDHDAFAAAFPEMAAKVSVARAALDQYQAHQAPVSPAEQVETDDAEKCNICAIAFQDGDDCLTDIELGSVHAACCGPEREAYVNLDTGEPIGPVEPIPTPWKWSADA